MATAPVNTGPITLDDVRQALGDTDPTSTNAGALQKLIGRGSNATVQKHLDAIRQERTPVAAPAPGQTPTAPADAVAVLWSAAYAAAQVLTLARLERVTAEREQLTATVSQLSADLSAALAQVDSLAEQASATDAAMANANTERDEALQSADKAKQTLEASRIDFETLKREGQAKEALLKKDAQNAALTLQATIDRLTDQVGELKSLLHRPASPKTGV